jgi:hypothetical protein
VQSRCGDARAEGLGTRAQRPAPGLTPRAAPVVAIRAALNLALTRVAVCALVLTSSELWGAADWAAAGRALRAPAYGLAWALPLLTSSAGWLPWVQGSCAFACALGLLGWRTRWTLPLAAVSAAVLFALPQFTGAPRHSMHLVWFLAVLAVSPCALRLRLPWRNASPSLENAEACLRLTFVTLWALLAAIYFFPGWWKLRESGAAWALSDNLQNQMYWKWFQFGALPRWRPDAHPALVRLGALGVLGFELGFPFLLLRRSGRLAAAAAGIAFHSAAALVMFLPFEALLGCYVVLVDWEWLWAWLHDANTPEAHATLREVTRQFWHAVRGTLGRRDQLLAGLAAIVVTGASIAGIAGAMQAFPFACYPTFQWRASADMPDLWIAVVRGGKEEWLADSPALGGVRPQARWGMAWRASGVYGEPVRLERLVGYYQSLPVEVRRGVQAGDTLRFYATRVRVQPEAWRSLPRMRTLLAEWKP